MVGVCVCSISSRSEKASSITKFVHGAKLIKSLSCLCRLSILTQFCSTRVVADQEFFCVLLLVSDYRVVYQVSPGIVFASFSANDNPKCLVCLVVSLVTMQRKELQTKSMLAPTLHHFRNTSERTHFFSSQSSWLLECGPRENKFRRNGIFGKP